MIADERSALIALAHCVEPADESAGRIVMAAGVREFLDRIRSGRTGLRHGPALQARLAAANWKQSDDLAARIGSRIITRADREWPTQFADLGAVEPFALWVTGAADLRLVALRSVSIVGARACTGYGAEVSYSWAAQLAGEGWMVVSGGAFGIDAAAHRGALAVDGVTACFLASGVDVPYPSAHRALLEDIASSGLVLSESPIGEPARRQRFLSRNRLISALTRATIVVEAADRSGTSVTARTAAELNRPVLAVPGPVTSAVSAGCHRMIRDGMAMLACSVTDVLQVIDFSSIAAERAVPDSGRDALAMRDRVVLDALPRRGCMDLDALVRASGLAAGDVLAAVGQLEFGEWIVSKPEGWALARRTS